MLNIKRKYNTKGDFTASIFQLWRFGVHCQLSRTMATQDEARVQSGRETQFYQARNKNLPTCS